MSITRWNPLQEMLSLREAMNQLLEQSVISPDTAGGRGAQGAMQNLAVDVSEQDDAYEVTASLPGVDQDDIQVTVQGETLTIRAEMQREDERREGNYLLRERRRGLFQRSLALPGPIDTSSVHADFDNGVLKLRLPKSEASRPRQVEVRAGEGSRRRRSSRQIAEQGDGQKAQGQDRATQSRSQADGERRQTASQSAQDQRQQQDQAAQASAAEQAAAQRQAETANRAG